MGSREQELRNSLLAVEQSVTHPLQAEPVDGGREVATVSQIHDQTQVLLREENLLQQTSTTRVSILVVRLTVLLCESWI